MASKVGVFVQKISIMTVFIFISTLIIVASWGNNMAVSDTYSATIVAENNTTVGRYEEAIDESNSFEVAEEEATEEVVKEPKTSGSTIAIYNKTVIDDESFTKIYVSKHEQVAKLFFDPTEKMKVGETKVIDAYITTNISRNISEEYGINETLKCKDINITPRVKATLVGEEVGAFNIETIPPNFDGVQPIVGERTTIWSWQVTPLRSGKHRLLLSVDYVIPLNPSETSDYLYYKTLGNIKEEIEVEVNIPYLIETNLEWIVVGVIIPLLPSYAWLKRRISARRKTQ